jgi:S1-C subfamily serine protease
MTDPLTLTAASIATYSGNRLLTRASGFYFERDSRLFLVTSRHVLIDEGSRHFPDRISIELHVDAFDLTRSTGFSIPLYRGGVADWRQGRDSGGDVDVAAIEIERDVLPPTVLLRAFTPAHLHGWTEEVPVGSAALVLGFPLGFHDTLHHLPVVRNAVIASSFGVRFQGQGFFLTDSRTHRGTSGAPVVMRWTGDGSLPQDLPWKLLGVHSGRLDMLTRDHSQDESLGLNCAWYADILLTLTA